MENAKVTPPLSERAKAALAKELEKPDYKILDEETATFEAAKALVAQETLDHVIFDRTNPADRFVLNLVAMN